MNLDNSLAILLLVFYKFSFLFYVGASFGKLPDRRMAVTIFLAGIGPDRSAKALSPIDARPRLVLAASDRDDGGALRRFQPALGR